jgi:D-tyrosyl-tRNA(Tyr) deacylase
MIGLLQRVSRADVTVDGDIIAEIGAGLLVLIGVERGDTEAQAARLLERLLAYRVFADPQGRMNLSVVDAGGSLLLVPQFTLAADTGKGNRPGFSRAADPARGRELYDRVVRLAEASGVPVASGRFGAPMRVTLSNEGPVTFWLQVAPGVE